MHLFAAHKHFVPLRGCWYSSTCCVFDLHPGSLGVVHKELQSSFAVPLTTAHAHLFVQSSVIKVWLISYVLLPYSHFAEIIIIKKDLNKFNWETKSAIFANSNTIMPITLAFPLQKIAPITYFKELRRLIAYNSAVDFVWLTLLVLWPIKHKIGKFRLTKKFTALLIIFFIK